MDEELRRRLAPVALRPVALPTLQAVLEVPRDRAEDYARLLGATNSLTFGQFVAGVVLSGPHERPDATVWQATARAIDDFLIALGDESAPAHPLTRDPDPTLVAGTLGAVVMSAAEALDYPEDDGGISGYRLGPLTCVAGLLPGLRAMLDELDRHQAR